MIINTGYGSSAAVRVLHATSSNVLPANARNGTICVITALSPTDVYLQKDKPGSVKSGAVWLVQGDGKLTVEAARNANVTIVSAAQWNGSQWNNVDVYQYLNGKWEPNRLYLLYRADEYTATTGGWKLFSTHRGTSIKTENGVLMTEDNFGNQRGTMQTTNKINLMGIRQFVCRGQITAYALPVKLGIQVSSQPNYQHGEYDDEHTWYSNTAYVEANAAGRFEIALDVTAYNSGLYYVGVSSGSDAVIEEIWAEYN